MNTNYDQIGDLVRLARSVGTNLRVNVYQPRGKNVCTTIVM